MRIFAFLLTAICLSAQPHPINFQQALTGADGKALSNDKGVPITLGEVCVTALYSQSQDDQNKSGLDKFKLGQLAARISEAKAVSLSVEDLALIKERVGKFYCPAVVYAAWPLLDPSVMKEAAKAEAK